MDNTTRQMDLVSIIQRNERKSRNRLTALILICITLGLVTIYFGFDSKRKADELRQKTIELQNTKIALEITNENIEESRISLFNAKDSLRLLLSKISANIKDPLIKAEINEEISLRAESGSVVYIQEFGLNIGQISKEIQATLKKMGYTVPTIEKMKKDFKKSSIIYFYDEDIEIANSVYEQIKPIILNFDPDFNIEQLKPRKSRSNLKPPSRQIEVWLRI